MQIVANKEKLYINRVVGQKDTTITVEEDFVVPDVKPDILSVLHTSGTVCVYKKEILDDKVKIDGCVNTYIMYLADGAESSIRGLNANIDFSKQIDFHDVKQDMMLESNVTIKSIECRVLNGRKINIKATIDVSLKVLSNEEVEFVNEIEECKDIQILNESLKLNSLLGCGTTKAYAKDTIMLDSIDNLIEVLKVDINLINKEVKTSYNKVLVKADVWIKMDYLTEDGRICSKSQLIPVMGFIDMQDISDEDICDINYEIKNIIIKPNGMEEHSVYIEIELEISCNSYKTKEVNIIQDLYSPSIDLKYEQKNIDIISEKKIEKDIYSIREKQIIPDIGNSRIYDVDVKPIVTKQTILKDRIVYEGEIDLTFLYESEVNRGIDFKNISVPFNYNMECPGIIQTSKVETTIDITMQDFTIMTDQNIDMKIDMEFIVNMNNTKKINVIEQIECEEIKEKERNSLVIYFVKPNDTLWNIAKRFHSTVKNIAEINEIQDENKLEIGQKLFIPFMV